MLDIIKALVEIAAKLLGGAEKQQEGKHMTGGAPSQAKRVFFSYAHEDQELRDQLEKHLSALKRQGVISTWHDRDIGAGTEWAGRISDELERADIILLLVSASFFGFGLL